VSLKKIIVVFAIISLIFLTLLWEESSISKDKLFVQKTTALNPSDFSVECYNNKIILRPKRRDLIPKTFHPRQAFINSESSYSMANASMDNNAVRIDFSANALQLQKGSKVDITLFSLSEKIRIESARCWT